VASFLLAGGLSGLPAGTGRLVAPPGSWTLAGGADTSGRSGRRQDGRQRAGTTGQVLSLRRGSRGGPGSVRATGACARAVSARTQLNTASAIRQARATAWPLARDDHASFEDLAAPDPVGFAAFDRSGQARSAQRAGPAMRPGQLQVGWQAGEPQLRVLALARQQPVQCLRLAGEHGHGGDGHDLLPVAVGRPGADRPGWPRPAGPGTGRMAGGLMGAHDVGIARVVWQRRLPPAFRPVTALGDADLPHLWLSSGPGSVWTLRGRGMARRHPKVPIGVESSAESHRAPKCHAPPAPPAGPLIAGICSGSRGEAGRECWYGLVMLRGGTGSSRRHGSILPSACMAPAPLVRRRAGRTRSGQIRVPVRTPRSGAG